MLSIVLLIFYFLMFQFQIMSDTIDFSSLVFNICGVQCKSNTSLRKHTKGVHDDRQFSCDICDMKIDPRCLHWIPKDWSKRAKW